MADVFVSFWIFSPGSIAVPRRCCALHENVGYGRVCPFRSVRLASLFADGNVLRQGSLAMVASLSRVDESLWKIVGDFSSSSRLCFGVFVSAVCIMAVGSSVVLPIN